MPDRITIRKLEGIMRALKAVKPDDPRFQAAQARFQEARVLYQAQARMHAETRAGENASEAAQVAREAGNNDQGPLTAGILGGLQGLGGAAGGTAGALAGSALGPLGALGGGLLGGILGGAAVKPAAQGMAAIVPGGVTGGDVGQQWSTTAEAHPYATMGGQVAGGAGGGWLASKAIKAAGGLMAARAPRMSKPGTTVEVVPPKVAPAPKAAPSSAPPGEMEVPTFMRRGGKAAKDVASQAQKAPSADEALSASLAAGKAEELALEKSARELVFRRQGFSAADAREMAEQGVTAPKELVAQMSRRLKAAAKARARK